MAKSVGPLPDQPRLWVILFLSTGLAAILLAQILGTWTHRYWNADHFSEWTIPEIKPVDPNTATFAELELIPGLGKKRAEEIVELRKTKKFNSLDDFRAIKGIGPKRLETLSTWLVFPEPNKDHTPLPEPEEPKPLAALPIILDPEKPETRNANAPQKVDPNKASREELIAIPGIGPKLAEKILETREKSGFQSLDDLVRVPGIGRKNLKALKPYFEISP